MTASILDPATPLELGIWFLLMLALAAAGCLLIWAVSYLLLPWLARLGIAIEHWHDRPLVHHTTTTREHR